MLDSVFVSILDLTKVSSLVILAVIAARLLLKRAPKVVSYALWAVVLLRLLVPMEIQSPVSLLPELKPTTQSYALEDEPISAVNAGVAAYQAVGDVLNGGIGTQHVPTDRVDEAGNVEYVVTDFDDVWILFGSYVWAAGVTGLAVYSLFGIFKLKRKLREAIRLEEGVYLAEGIESPFVMGMLRPKIYLPQGLTDGERSYILAHERYHIRRCDPLWKALGFAALCIHWFNPLVWLAFSLACRDMEMSCDEAVLKTMGGSIRSDYAASLLKIATGRKAIVGGPLAFGEGDPKGRIKNLARWKKPVIWLSILAVIVCIVLAVCLLTNPVTNRHSKGSHIFGQLDALEGNWLRLNCASGEIMEFTLADDYTIPEGIQVGDHVMVRLDYRNETKERIINRVALTGESLPALPDQAIEDTIKRMNGTVKRGQFAAVSFVTLSIGETGTASMDLGDTRVETVEVRGMALYQVYTNRNGKLHEVSGSHIPVALKFRVTDGGEYILSEYWQPRDGSYYAQDLKDQFGYVPDTQKYIKQQQAECLEKAEAYYKIGQPARPLETVPPTTEKIYIFDLSKVPDDGSLPIEELPTDYKPENAIRDGALIVEDDMVCANDEVWTEFLNKVEAGEPARMRIVFYSRGTLVGVRDVLFDGEIYQMRNALCYSDGNLSHVQEQDFYQLVRNRGENTYEDGTVYETYDQYYLALHNAFTRQPQAYWGVYKGMTAVLVYRKSTTNPQTPAIPETLTSAKLMLEDKVLGEVKGADKLESLRNLLANAQKMGEPSFWDYEDFCIVFTDANGAELRIEISFSQDFMGFNGVFYDYGPGRWLDQNGQPQDKNAILNLARHFGLEDWPEAVREYCLKRGWEPPRHSLAVLSGEEEHG